MALVKELTLLPPADNACSLCGVEHEPDEPHNARSLYYQYNFFADHGRWPTWKDAMAHCSPETQTIWTEELLKLEVPETDL